MIEKLIGVRNAMQYDGSNAAAILAAMDSGDVTANSIVLVSEAGGDAVFEWENAGPNQVTVHTGDWLEVGRVPSGLQLLEGSTVAAYFVKVSDLD